MTRKPLPKAITRSLDELREIAAGAAVIDEEAPQTVLPRDSEGAKRSPAFSTQPRATDLRPAPSIGVGPQAAKRRSVALRIVDRHRNYAAIGGLFPLPIVNVAGVTAIIMRMVKQLSSLYQVPFQRDRTRSAIIGLIGGAVPTGFGAVTASTLAFIVPGGALVGLGVSAIAAGALTRGIGMVFVEHFESDALPLDVSAAESA
jgi:uncharacterized protein (DUF697 family)